MADSSLTVVYALVVLYALCYQLQSPLEPFLVEKFVKGEDAASSYARLVSFFSFMQIVGSFVVGYLLDVIGLRAMFALNFLSCAASYALLARATSIEMLFLSKVPALFQAGFLCAQTAAAKLTPDGQERATSLGRLTTAYTVGGVIGPALGGHLGTQVAARVAVVGSFAAILLVMMLPTTVEEVPRDAKRGADKLPAAAASSAATTYWPRLMRTILPLVWPLLATKMASGLINSSAGAVRPLLLKERFAFDQSRLGAFMSAMFLGNAVVGLGLGKITALLGGERSAIVTCLGMMALGYAVMAMVFEEAFANIAQSTPHGGVWLFMALTLLLSLFQFPLATTLTALSTSRVRN